MDTPENVKLLLPPRQSRGDSRGRLVPKPAALRILWRGMSPAQAAQEYGVSEALIRMQLNLTGARFIVDRTRARRGNLGQSTQR